jgi:hypothetical protein
MLLLHLGAVQREDSWGGRSGWVMSRIHEVFNMRERLQRPHVQQWLMQYDMILFDMLANHY